MAETFINSTSWIGQAFDHISYTVTGSEYLTILLIILLLVTIMLIFRVPLLFIFLFISPLIMIGMAFYQEFYVVGLIFYGFLGIVVASNFFLRN